jgi:hypothetical protein
MRRGTVRRPRLLPELYREVLRSLVENISVGAGETAVVVFGDAFRLFRYIEYRTGLSRIFRLKVYKYIERKLYKIY